MSDPGDLQALLDDVWRHLARGVADRQVPARHPTFATVSPDGRPQARTVVLRAATRSSATLEVHTDTRSAKITALGGTPCAQFHIWEADARLQIRLSTRVTILTGAATADRWARVPDTARVSYGTRPAPGTPIANVYDYENPHSPECFAVLSCAIEHMDIVHLDTRHRRAAFSREDGWRGVWLAP